MEGSGYPGAGEDPAAGYLKVRAAKVREQCSIYLQIRQGSLDAARESLIRAALRQNRGFFWFKRPRFKSREHAIQKLKRTREWRFIGLSTEKQAQKVEALFVTAKIAGRYSMRISAEMVQLFQLTWAAPTLYDVVDTERETITPRTSSPF